MLANRLDLRASASLTHPAIVGNGVSGVKEEHGKRLRWILKEAQMMSFDSFFLVLIPHDASSFDRFVVVFILG